MAQSRSTKFTRIKLPKTKQDAYDRMHADMVYANRNHLIGTFLREDLPLEWHLLEVDHPVHEKKEKVTLYLDRSVARMHRHDGALEAAVEEIARQHGTQRSRPPAGADQGD